MERATRTSVQAAISAELMAQEIIVSTYRRTAHKRALPAAA